MLKHNKKRLDEDNMDKSIKLYAVTHKNSNKELIDDYNYLLVGAKKFINIPEGYISDDSNDNISEKNDSYCELTGLYWMWKNVDVEYIGLVHYRRFFVKFDCWNKCIRGRYLVGKKDAYHVLNRKEVLTMLEKNIFIVKESPKRKESTWDAFVNVFGDEYCKSIKDIIYKSHPEYVDSFEKCMKYKTHYNCNMFIGKKYIADQYSEWLFSILEEMDKRHIRKTGDRYHNRELGYIGELLFRVWLEKNNVKCKIVPAINIEDDNAAMTIGDFIKFSLNWAKK